MLHWMRPAAMTAVMGLVWLLTGCEASDVAEPVDVSALQARLSAVEARLEVAEVRVDETAATVAGLSPAVVPEVDVEPGPEPTQDHTFADRLADHAARIQALEVEGATQHWVIEQGYAGVAEQGRLSELVQAFGERLNDVPTALDRLASQLAAGLGRVGALEAALEMQSAAMGAVQVLVAPDGALQAAVDTLQAAVDTLRDELDELVVPEGRLAGIEAAAAALTEWVTTETERLQDGQMLQMGRDDSLAVRVIALNDRWRTHEAALDDLDRRVTRAQDWAAGANEGALMNGAELSALRANGTLIDLLGYLTVDARKHEIYLTGANLNVRKRHENQLPDGLGNVIIGRNHGPAETKTGSHNLIVGGSHTYTSVGGMAVGEGHAILNRGAVAVGGSRNTVEAPGASAFGGHANVVSGHQAAAFNGYSNVVTGRFASAVGGENSEVTGTYAVAVGGDGSMVSGGSAVAIGGQQLVAGGEGSAVVGGRNTAENRNFGTTVGQ